jgi:hypothetical protein
MTTTEAATTTDGPATRSFDLVVVDPASPVIVAPALVNGFLVGPLVLAGLGAHLLRPRR